MSKLFPESMTVYEVGGCIRDDLLGISTNDIDFSVEYEGSFTTFCDELRSAGFEIYKVDEKYYTARARFPKDANLPSRYKGLTGDFVLARKDGAYFDGRRPESVEPGSILDDLRRRDFTINAMARNVDTGVLTDPFQGKADILMRYIRFVGDPRDRIAEDGLRVLRAYRFFITKPRFAFEPNTAEVIESEFAAEMLEKVSIERVWDELMKMLKHDTLATMKLLHEMPFFVREAIFRDGLWLKPTLEKS